jgi:PAS domain S-box-containing protein
LSNNENGNHVKIIGSMCDVTRRKQMENALRKSEAQKTALLDAAVDRIRYVDTDMKIIWANKTTIDASGMAPEDLIGKPCYQLFVGRNTPCEGCPTLRSKKTGRIERAVIQQPGANGIRGESYWDAYCVPLKNEAGNPESFIQIARNITEQRRAEEQIRTLTQELMKAQESERQMISRELHDRVAQELAAVKINCEMLLNHHPAIPPEIRLKISEMTRTLQESIKAVRDLSYDLRPPVLDEMGLVQTLFQYCHDFSENNGINVDFSAAGMKGLKLDFDTEISLYRLVQEGLTNIKKHADAGHVTIRLVAASPNIILRIEDNGRGFDVQERLANITKEKRMGIRSIEERVKLLQGEMVLRSKPKQGTKIFIKFPYKGKRADL